MLKFAVVRVQSSVLIPTDASPAQLRRIAHRHHFDFEPRPGYLYVRSRAISSRTNDNFDEFPAEEIAQGYRTFIGKPVFVNHVNDNHKRARGVVIDAALHKDRLADGAKDWWAEVLMEIDGQRFPKLAEAIRKKRIDTTSMGCDVAYSLCSMCGNKATTPAEYCHHIPRLKGKKVLKRNAKTGAQEEHLIRETCYGLSFFENSLLVEEPADPTALFIGIDDHAKTASKAAAKEAVGGPDDGGEPQAWEETWQQKQQDQRRERMGWDLVDHLRVAHGIDTRQVAQHCREIGIEKPTSMDEIKESVQRLHLHLHDGDHANPAGLDRHTHEPTDPLTTKDWSASGPGGQALLDHLFTYNPHHQPERAGGMPEHHEPFAPAPIQSLNLLRHFAGWYYNRSKVSGEPIVHPAGHPVKGGRPGLDVGDHVLFESGHSARIQAVTENLLHLEGHAPMHRGPIEGDHSKSIWSSEVTEQAGQDVPQMTEEQRRYLDANPKGPTKYSLLQHFADWDDEDDEDDDDTPHESDSSVSVESHGYSAVAHGELLTPARRWDPEHGDHTQRYRSMDDALHHVLHKHHETGEDSPVWVYGEHGPVHRSGGEDVNAHIEKHLPNYLGEGKPHAARQHGPIDEHSSASQIREHLLKDHEEDPAHLHTYESFGGRDRLGDILEGMSTGMPTNEILTNGPSRPVKVPMEHKDLLGHHEELHERECPAGDSECPYPNDHTHAERDTGGLFDPSAFGEQGKQDAAKSLMDEQKGKPGKYSALIQHFAAEEPDELDEPCMGGQCDDYPEPHTWHEHFQKNKARGKDPWGRPLMQPYDGHGAWACNNYDCVEHPQEMYEQKPGQAPGWMQAEHDPHKDLTREVGKAFHEQGLTEDARYLLDQQDQGPTKYSSVAPGATHWCNDCGKVEGVGNKWATESGQCPRCQSRNIGHPGDTTPTWGEQVSGRHGLEDAINEIGGEHAGWLLDQQHTGPTKYSARDQETCPHDGSWNSHGQCMQCGWSAGSEDDEECDEPYCQENGFPEGWHTKGEHMDAAHLDPGHPDYQSAEKNINDAIGGHPDAWMFHHQPTGPSKYSALMWHFAGPDDLHYDVPEQPEDGYARHRMLRQHLQDHHGYSHGEIEDTLDRLETKPGADPSKGESLLNSINELSKTFERMNNVDRLHQHEHGDDLTSPAGHHRGDDSLPRHDHGHPDDPFRVSTREPDWYQYQGDPKSYRSDKSPVQYGGAWDTSKPPPEHRAQPSHSPWWQHHENSFIRDYLHPDRTDEHPNRLTDLHEDDVDWDHDPEPWDKRTREELGKHGLDEERMQRLEACPHTYPDTHSARSYPEEGEASQCKTCGQEIALHATTRPSEIGQTTPLFYQDRGSQYFKDKVLGPHEPLKQSLNAYVPPEEPAQGPEHEVERYWMLTRHLAEHHGYGLDDLRQYEGEHGDRYHGREPGGDDPNAPPGMKFGSPLGMAFEEVHQHAHEGDLMHPAHGHDHSRPDDPFRFQTKTRDWHERQVGEHGIGPYVDLDPRVNRHAYDPDDAWDRFQERVYKSAPVTPLKQSLNSGFGNGDADRWVTCDQGHRHWGAAGAAGLLIRHTDDHQTRRYLLQHRAPWTDHGDTWGIPAGALHHGEAPEDGAMRESHEELGGVPHGLTHVHTHVDDHGSWAFHTVVMDSPSQWGSSGGEDADHEVGEGGTQWYTAEEMKGLDLHPGFAKTWPKLQSLGHRRTAVGEMDYCQQCNRPITRLNPGEPAEWQHDATAGGAGVPHQARPGGTPRPADEGESPRGAAGAGEAGAGCPGGVCGITGAHRHVKRAGVEDEPCEECGKPNDHIHLDQHSMDMYRAIADAAQTASEMHQHAHQRVVNLKDPTDLEQHLMETHDYEPDYDLWRNSHDQDHPALGPGSDEDRRLTHHEVRRLHDWEHGHEIENEHPDYDGGMPGTFMGDSHFHTASKQAAVGDNPKKNLVRQTIPAEQVREGDYLDIGGKIRVHRTLTRGDDVTLAWRQRGSKAPGIRGHQVGEQVHVWRRPEDSKTSSLRKRTTWIGDHPEEPTLYWRAPRSKKWEVHVSNWTPSRDLRENYGAQPHQQVHLFHADHIAAPHPESDNPLPRGGWSLERNSNTGEHRFTPNAWGNVVPHVPPHVMDQVHKAQSEVDQHAENHADLYGQLAEQQDIRDDLAKVPGDMKQEEVGHRMMRNLLNAAGQTTCPHCDGEGNTERGPHTCGMCDGRGFLKQSARGQAKLPGGFLNEESDPKDYWAEPAGKAEYNPLYAHHGIEGVEHEEGQGPWHVTRHPETRAYQVVDKDNRLAHSFSTVGHPKYELHDNDAERRAYHVATQANQDHGHIPKWEDREGNEAEFTGLGDTVGQMGGGYRLSGTGHATRNGEVDGPVDQQHVQFHYPAPSFAHSTEDPKIKEYKRRAQEHPAPEVYPPKAVQQSSSREHGTTYRQVQHGEPGYDDKGAFHDPSPSEEWHGPYKVIKHPDTGKYHVADNQNRITDYGGREGMDEQHRAEYVRDYADGRQSSKEHGKALAESLWGGAMEALDPGGTDESRRTERHGEALNSLMHRYEGGDHHPLHPGKFGWDDHDEEGDEKGAPYYEVKDPAGSGFKARDYGGKYVEIHHEATGPVESVHVAEENNRNHDVIRSPAFGHEELHRELHNFVHGDPNPDPRYSDDIDPDTGRGHASGPDYARNDPDIERWQRRKGYRP